jgi:hypothetical protein
MIRICVLYEVLEQEHVLRQPLNGFYEKRLQVQSPEYVRLVEFIQEFVELGLLIMRGICT